MGEVKVLTAHQTLLLEMLKDFDAVCRKHHNILSALRRNGVGRRSSPRLHPVGR